MQAVIECSKKQIDFLSRTERIGLLCAGLGFGKSFIGALWLIKKCLETPGAVAVMASKDYGQLSLALDKELQLVLHLMGLKEGQHFSRLKSPKLSYKFLNGAAITGVSAKNYDSAFRGININFLLLDEVAFYEPEAFQAALGRVRKNPSEIRCVTTPQGFNFLWEYFVENPVNNSFCIKATTYDNELLPDEYIESLKDSYPDKLFQQECMAEFIDLTAESAYYEFSRDFHVAEVKKLIHHPIYCGLDFNVCPLAGVFFQVVDDKIMVFDELWLADNADTYKAGSAIRDRYGTEVKIIPDATGKNRSTTGPSNHTILRNMGFKLLYSSNPFVFDRVMQVNHMLKHRRIIIDPKCVNLIKCLSKTTWNDSGKLDQAKDKTLTHASDALGYAVFRLFPPRSIIKSPIQFS